MILLFPAFIFKLKSTVRIAMCLGAIASALSTTGFAAVGGALTLTEAQAIAVERSRQLPAQDFAVTASRDLAVAAGRLPDPLLRIGLDNLPITGSDRFSIDNDFMTMRRVGISQEITRTEKRQLRADRFEREADKSIAEKTAITAEIQRDTALAWLERYYAEAMAEVVADQAQQARLEIEAAEGAYRAGRGSQADIFSARGALAALDDRASEIQRRVLNAKTLLERWIGSMAEMPLAGKPDTNIIRLDPATLDSQLAHHPQITVLNKQEEIAATEAELARANRKADWTVGFAYQQRGSAFSNMVSVDVWAPLQWDQKNRQNRELSSKLAVVEQVKAQREETLRVHIAETRLMVNEWENGRERLTRYERELIPLAKNRTLAAITAYRGGKLTLGEVLIARRNEIDVKIESLQLQTEVARLWAQLNFLFPTDGTATHSAMITSEDQNEK